MQIVNLNELQGDNQSEIKKYLIRRDAELSQCDEMLIDSERVIDRAIKAGVRIKSVMLTPETLTKHMAQLGGFDNLKIFVGSENEIQKIVGGRIHQTMMAVAERPIAKHFANIYGNVVILNGIEDPQNVGSILRNCHAFGIKNVIFDPKCCSPYSRRSIRVSMGSVFWPNIFLISSLDDTLNCLKDKGYSIVSAHLGPKSQNIRDHKFRDPSALIIGSEFKGVCKSVLDISDAVVKIPIVDSVDSLNAASASAILIERMTY